MTAAQYRRMAEEALKRAMATLNMAERSRLLGEAAYWTAKAKDADNGYAIDAKDEDD